MNRISLIRFCDHIYQSAETIKKNKSDNIISKISKRLLKNKDQDQEKFSRQANVISDITRELANAPAGERKELLDNYESLLLRTATGLKTLYSESSKDKSVKGQIYRNEILETLALFYGEGVSCSWKFPSLSRCSRASNMSS
jgi:hypothetical protein